MTQGKEGRVTFHPVDAHLAAIAELNNMLPQRPVDQSRAASALEQSLTNAAVDARAAVGAKIRR